MKLTSVISLFILLLAIGSCCNKDSFVCKCDTSHLKRNDSILRIAFSDTNFLNIQHKYYKLEPLNKKDQESYRLRMSHAFSRYTHFYTLTKTDSGAILEVRQYHDSRDTDVRLDKKYNVLLTETEWESFKYKVNANCYWSNEVAKHVCKGCLDGGSWMLQGYDPERRNCAKGKQHLDVCDFGDQHELGEICMEIRKYAKEERLTVYPKY